MLIADLNGKPANREMMMNRVREEGCQIGRGIDTPVASERDGTREN
jgi:hypothetical protein